VRGAAVSACVAPVRSVTVAGDTTTLATTGAVGVVGVVGGGGTVGVDGAEDSPEQAAATARRIPRADRRCHTPPTRDQIRAAVAGNPTLQTPLCQGMLMIATP
jgi:hypothetical protein